MYRPNNFRWKLVHVASILAHLGLICAGSVAYIYNNIGRSPKLSMQQLQQLHNAPFRVNTVSGHDPCPFTWMEVADGIQNWGTFDVASQTLLLTCIFLGAFGLFINIAMFCILLAVESNKVTLTEGQQHWRKQIVTFFACVLNVILSAAGVGLVGLLGANVAETRSMMPSLILASIQSPLALSTAIYDAVKNHQEGKDLLD
ncbi:hypothetical protein QBC43DRAFT_221393 [Cladorrhinum sp. PSN259]|nr:hypothetical protein QBC43DRAFT_221393 [Cladorrhinum sp. PSN259]